MNTPEKINDDTDDGRKVSRRDMLRISGCGMGVLLLPGSAPLFGTKRFSSGAATSSPLRILSRTAYERKLRAEAIAPPWYGALYAQPTGRRLLHLQDPVRVSDDNGCTWTAHDMKPDFSKDLPYGYRRNTVTSVVDQNTGRLFTLVNSLDTPGLDPNKIEPPVAQFTYYLRYRVSEDGGRSWAYEEPIVGAGKYSPQNPFEGIHIGKSAFYIGDRGSKPIVTREGKVLVPSQTTPLNADGTAYNPGQALTYTDVLILMGTWTKKGRLTWEAAQRACSSLGNGWRLPSADEWRALTTPFGGIGDGSTERMTG